MQVRIGIDDPAASAELFDWLRADADLVRGAEVQPGPVKPGSLAALEIIDVVLGQVTAISALVLAIEAWLRSRTRSETLTITRADGATLVLPTGDAANPDSIRAFLAVEDGESAQAGH